MGKRRLLRFLGGSAGAAALVAGLMIGFGASPAEAATKIIDCDGKSVTLKGEYEQAYKKGQVVFTNNNPGKRNPFKGANAEEFGDVPMCGVRLVDGKSVAEWAYCTDEGKYACGQKPSKTAPANRKLGKQDEKRIGYLVQNLPSDSVKQRSKLQIQVWCISQKKKAGTVDQSTVAKFTRIGVKLSESDAACMNPKKDIDPHIAGSDSLSVSGPTGTTPVGEDAVFTVKTDISTPIKISASDATGKVKVCANDKSGAKLTDGQLTVKPKDGKQTSVKLCATRESAGTVKLTAAAKASGGTNVRWHTPGSDCQVYVNVNAVKKEVKESATAAFSAKPAPTPTPTLTSGPAPTPSVAPTCTPGGGGGSGNTCCAPGSSPSTAPGGGMVCCAPTGGGSGGGSGGDNGGATCCEPSEGGNTGGGGSGGEAGSGCNVAGGGTGSLPVTGAQVGMIALAGVLLAGGGTAAVLVARRRRNATEGIPAE